MESFRPDLYHHILLDPCAYDRFIVSNAMRIMIELLRFSVTIKYSFVWVIFSLDFYICFFVLSTGIILTRMPATLRLQSFLRKLHILIAFYLTQKSEDNMTVQGLRCFPFLSFHIVLVFFILLMLSFIRVCML